ncbi:hypothetical protein HCU01_19340 [Halomonas cupida]|uniref:Uncharacterized protein n=1 Tax=Halomonas cupida TaxID=44933 RepID=A0A1M7I1P5_9GAMM|nr:hypothetical protein HCU01_19340 [Halomonas cupida]SHM34568.1 hypothetical protein SAMN05660971_02770 [Halomonas cupida]
MPNEVNIRSIRFRRNVYCSVRCGLASAPEAPEMQSLIGDEHRHLRMVLYFSNIS